MSDISEIRKPVRDGQYVFTEHCLDKSLPDEDFEIEDALHSLLTGYINETLDHDPKGTRYCVVGEAEDGRGLEVVCRFTEQNELLIITAYEVFFEDEEK